MTCLECKNFKVIEDGERGAVHGQCKLKDSHDWRYGMQPACKSHFEYKYQDKHFTADKLIDFFCLYIPNAQYTQCEQLAWAIDQYINTKITEALAKKGE